MIDFYEIVKNTPLDELIEKYPIVNDFMVNMNLGELDTALPLAEAVESADEEWLEEIGTDAEDAKLQLVDFLSALSSPEDVITHLDSITIVGGRDKSGEAEDIELTVRSGEVVSIVGPTGSGKSRLLGDIECMAQGDTPTGRRIKINGRYPDDDLRFELEGHLVAQLSQNMNFIMDLSVKKFLEMHAKSRFCENADEIVQQCFERANELAGEKFTDDVKVTQLSGGQSRALMIADTAYMSSSPIVLIDEIENAGIDRKQAISILAKNDKIVFISTHDPLLALSADRRIVIKNGGISKVIETTAEERESQEMIEKLDNTIMNIRNMLRHGELITRESVEMTMETR